ncbi:hypothetical protein [Chryseobacterium aquaticum]|uniref:GIY-YIG domain-containing protein n=1 Tax=Chryseobacterium aquaticum subsp. greenlandense TaxID=345663 RepID=A0A101CH35_9FLAO|nr:hypothetical protein [Chryseobacterium aquaticum]KUJ56104.1 hypothetical protein AR686_10925 [Chryseobacterium aquaticum subsp. greenlandense]
MKIDTKDIVKQSENFTLNIADQISKIRVQPFCEISFHSLEFRDRTTLKKYIDKIPKSNNPLIYVLQVQSSKKIKRLIEYFENYHSTNKLKTKNKDRVNLSRYNKTLSDILYVGSSTTDFKTRIKNHLGTEGTRVYSLHLCKWDNCLEYDLNIFAYECISDSDETIERFIVEILEQQFWDKLSPIFGKRSGL